MLPEDYPTIQSAIDASFVGDVVSVSPGTYLENIDFNGKAVVVRSTNGPGETIIDGNDRDRVVTFKNGEGRTSEISGFTLQRGLPTSGLSGYGGGVMISRLASPTIRNNVITNKHGCSGVGIAIFGDSNPIVEANVIAYNERVGCTGGGGGGIFCLHCGASIRNNTIIGNSSDGGGGVEINGSNGAVLRNNW